MTKIIVFGEFVLNNVSCYSWEEFYKKWFSSQLIQYEVKSQIRERKLRNNFEIGIPNDGKTYYANMSLRLAADGGIELDNYQWSENPFKLDGLNDRGVLRMISADLNYASDDTTSPTSFVIGHGVSKATYAINNAIGNIMMACGEILEEGKKFIPAVEDFTSRIKKSYTEDKELENFNIRDLILSNQEIIRQKVNSDWSDVAKVMNRYAIAANVILTVTKFAKSEDTGHYYTYDEFIEKLAVISDSVDLFPNAEIRIADIDCSDMVDSFACMTRFDINNVLHYIMDRIQVYVHPMSQEDIQKITSILNDNKDLYEMANVRNTIDILFGSRQLYQSVEFCSAMSPLAIFRFAELKEKAK